MPPALSEANPRQLSTAATAGGLLLCAIAALACVMPAQGDTWWLLRAGEEMWNSGHILLHDTFSHTVAGQYWPNHEWLSQVLFYAAYAIGGMPLLTAFCAAAVVTAWGTIWTIAPGDTVDRVLLVGGGAALSTAGWSLRPQVFTLALFALSMSVLLARRRYALLPPMYLLWANLHGGVAAGGLLIVAALAASLVVERRIERRLLVVAALCLIATALTPLGTSLWLEVPASLQRLKTYDVIEWRAPSLFNPSDLPFFAALTTVVVLSVKRREALRQWDALFLAFASACTALLALRSSRNVALFLLCAVPLVARLLIARVARRVPAVAASSRAVHGGWIVAAAALATTSFVAYAWSRPLDRLQWHPVSARMYEALQSCEGPLYNRYDEGGYLIWWVRNRPVFIDSRQDPFPESLVIEQLEVETTGDYRQTFERYGIACALTPAQSLLATELRADGWRSHDAGADWAVYTRPGRAL